MNRARNQFLAGAGLTCDEHRRIGRRHPLHVLEHFSERRRRPDQFFEIVRALDFFLQVDVLGFEPGLFLLHQHTLGNVHEHRARELAGRIGLGPPLNPQRLAVVFAA